MEENGQYFDKKLVFEGVTAKRLTDEFRQNSQTVAHFAWPALKKTLRQCSPSNTNFSKSCPRR